MILFKVTFNTIITLGTLLDSLSKSIKGVEIFSSKPFHVASYIVGLSGLNKLLNMALSLSTALYSSPSSSNAASSLITSSILTKGSGSASGFSFLASAFFCSISSFCFSNSSRFF